MADHEKAEEYYEKAVSLTEELRSTLSRDQREKFFDVRINGFLRTAPYDGLARVRMKLNKIKEAFKDSEYTKSRVFAEAMTRRTEGESFDIPLHVLTTDRELNDQLGALKKKLQQGYEKQNLEIIATIDPQVKQMREKLKAHVGMLRKQYPLFAATKYPEPMDLQHIALKDEEWVLSYHVTDTGTIIYLTKGKRIVDAVFKPMPRQKLEAAVQAFRKPVEMLPGDDFEEKLRTFDLAMGKELADFLLSDILQNLPQCLPVVIIPDDCLGTLPFEMLVLNDKGVIKTDKRLPHIAGAEFFGDRNPIAYAQSVTALTLSRIHSKGRKAHGGLLAIADPVLNEKDERIKGSTKEDSASGPLAWLYKSLSLMGMECGDKRGPLTFFRLEQTASLARSLAEMRKTRSKVCTGFDASKQNFLENIRPTLGQYDEVLFATHGYFGEDLPGIMEPILVLTLVPMGTDGYLRMSEVMGLNMNADIVALTACQTGIGARSTGEGTMGMGRAFQYAGSKNVLMSLWSVSQLTSVDLVKIFFENIQKGKNKLESLVAARNEIRGKGFDHPFFWAPFILVGEAN